MSKVNFRGVAEVLKIIAHPCRLHIIELLEGGEMQVKYIQDRLHCKQSVTSQHLTKMKNKGVLKARRCAKTVFYSIENFEILKIIKCLRNCPIRKRRNKCLKN